MKRLLATLFILVAVILPVILPSMALAADPVSVATSNYTPSGNNMQRHVYYVNGRFWVFYSPAYDLIQYKTSLDGITWSAATNVTTNVYSGAWDFTSFYNGSLHYTCSRYSGGTVYYRRGVLNSDGTITWASADVSTGLSANQSGFEGYVNPSSIAVDPATGYSYIAYRQDSDGHSYIVQSTNTSGGWTTGAGFPYELVDATGWRAVIVPLESGGIYVVYGTTGEKVRGISYNGSWGTAENVSQRNMSGLWGFSAAASGDTVEVIYSDATVPQRWYNCTRSAAGVWTEQVVSGTDSTSNYPAFTVLTSGDIAAFYVNASSNLTYYTTRQNGTWLDSPVLWATLSSDNVIDADWVSASYEEQSGKTSFLFATGDRVANNEVWHAYLDFPAVTTGTATGIEYDIASSSPQATLSGTLTDIGTFSSVNLSFEYGETPSYGSSTANTSANSTGAYSATISGYSQGATVYYRACVSCPAGVFYGSQDSFVGANHLSAYSGAGTVLGMVPMIVVCLFVMVGPAGTVAMVAVRRHQGTPIALGDLVVMAMLLVFSAVALICFGPLLNAIDAAFIS